MLKSLCCSERGSTPRNAALLIGLSLGSVALALVIQFVFAERSISQAILYASFPMALIASEFISKPRESRCRPLRWASLVLALAAMLAFFVVVMLIADRS